MTSSHLGRAAVPARGSDRADYGPVKRRAPDRAVVAR